VTKSKVLWEGQLPPSFQAEGYGHAGCSEVLYDYLQFSLSSLPSQLLFTKNTWTHQECMDSQSSLLLIGSNLSPKNTYTSPQKPTLRLTLILKTLETLPLTISHHHVNSYQPGQKRTEPTQATMEGAVECYL
jgi:hypothetical protein